MPRVKPKVDNESGSFYPVTLLVVIMLINYGLCDYLEQVGLALPLQSMLLIVVVLGADASFSLWTRGAHWRNELAFRILISITALLCLQVCFIHGGHLFTEQEEQSDIPNISNEELKKYQVPLD